MKPLRACLLLLLLAGPVSGRLPLDPPDLELSRVGVTRGHDFDLSKRVLVPHDMALERVKTVPREELRLDRLVLDPPNYEVSLLRKLLEPIYLERIRSGRAHDFLLERLVLNASDLEISQVPTRSSGDFDLAKQVLAAESLRLSPGTLRDDLLLEKIVLDGKDYMMNRVERRRPQFDFDL